MDEYIYMLKLRPDLLDDSAWTEKDEKIVSEHFNHLKEDFERGKVILAGRTTNSDKTQFGIVIFTAESWKSAQTYMESDPAIKYGVMTATLFPFRIALMKK
jgi:uncharacterized protein